MNSANRRVERDQNDKPSAGQHEDERRPLTAGSLVDCKGGIQRTTTCQASRSNPTCGSPLSIMMVTSGNPGLRIIFGSRIASVCSRSPSRPVPPPTGVRRGRPHKLVSPFPPQR